VIATLKKCSFAIPNGSKNVLSSVILYLKYIMWLYGNVILLNRFIKLWFCYIFLDLVMYCAYFRETLMLELTL
jgi:hypothetical protein